MSKIRLHGSSSGYTEITPVAASGNNTLTLPNDGTIISKDANGAVGVTSVHATNVVATGTAKVGSGVTLSSDGDVFFTGISTGNGSGLTGINTPSFSARNNTSQSLTAGSEAVIIFNTEDHDTDDAYNTSTGEFTVPAGKGGTYLINAHMGIDDVSSGIVVRLRVFKNNSQFYGMRAQNVGAATNTIITVHVSGVVTLNAGDVIKCMGFHNETTNGAEPIEIEANGFSMFRLAI